jgi:hypothetical protein
MNTLPTIDAQLTPAPPPVIGGNIEVFLNGVNRSMRISEAI